MLLEGAELFTARCGGLFSPCGRKKAPGLPLQKNDEVEDDGEVEVIICEGCALEARESLDISLHQSQGTCDFYSMVLHLLDADLDSVQKVGDDAVWQVECVSCRPEPETDPIGMSSMTDRQSIC
jgi:protein-arginine kinase activator protein McsA